MNRRTRQQFIYGLKDLTTSLLKQMEHFVCDLACSLKQLYTDVDDKLLCGDVGGYITSISTYVSGAPSYRHNQNGLCERNWYTYMRMAQSCLIAACLPILYWFLAIRRAIEVRN